MTKNVDSCASPLVFIHYTYFRNIIYATQLHNSICKTPAKFAKIFWRVDYDPLFQKFTFVKYTRYFLHLYMFCFSEPMKDSLIKQLVEKPPHVLKKDYRYGKNMWNQTYAMLEEFYVPSMKRMTTLLGDEKWMWGH